MEGVGHQSNAPPHTQQFRGFPLLLMVLVWVFCFYILKGSLTQPTFPKGTPQLWNSEPSGRGPPHHGATQAMPWCSSSAVWVSLGLSSKGRSRVSAFPSSRWMPAECFCPPSQARRHQRGPAVQGAAPVTRLTSLYHMLGWSWCEYQHYNPE